MIVESYVLHTYCGNPDCSAVYREEDYSFSGRDRRTARRLARKRGWRFLQHDVLCPACATGQRQ